MTIGRGSLIPGLDFPKLSPSLNPILANIRKPKEMIRNKEKKIHK